MFATRQIHMIMKIGSEYPQTIIISLGLFSSVIEEKILELMNYHKNALVLYKNYDIVFCNLFFLPESSQHLICPLTLLDYGKETCHTKSHILSFSYPIRQLNSCLLVVYRAFIIQLLEKLDFVQNAVRYFTFIII